MRPAGNEWRDMENAHTHTKAEGRDEASKKTRLFYSDDGGRRDHRLETTGGGDDKQNGGGDEQEAVDVRCSLAKRDPQTTRMILPFAGCDMGGAGLPGLWRVGVIEWDLFSVSVRYLLRVYRSGDHFAARAF